MDSPLPFRYLPTRHFLGVRSAITQFVVQVGAIGGAIAYVLEGTSWIHATIRMRMVHYILAQTVYSVVFEICGHCIRPMVTKQVHINYR